MVTRSTLPNIAIRSSLPIPSTRKVATPGRTKSVTPSNARYTAGKPSWDKKHCINIWNVLPMFIFENIGRNINNVSIQCFTNVI